MSPPQIASDEVERLRAETPGCANRIHLNNAGAGLMPAHVLAAMVEHLELEAEIGGYEAADARADAAADSYAAVAELLGCAGTNVAFASSATDAYSRALSSVPFEPGDAILTTEDDYISNQIAFLSLRKRLGVELVVAPTRPEGGVDPEAMARLMRERRPRLVAVTHMPTNSGLVQPVAEIGRHCRELGLLYLVDACQSLGQFALDVEEIGCDFLSATCRKFLRGPRGAGLLFVSDRALEHGYEPLFLDMRGARWVMPEEYAPVATAARFEDWEFSYAALLATGVAARFALDVGMRRIAARAAALAEELRDGLAGIAGVRVLDEGEQRSAIVTFALAGRDSDDVKTALAAHGINCSTSVREWAQYDFARKRVDSCVRLSPHYYNTEAEVAEAVVRVAEIAREPEG